MVPRALVVDDSAAYRRAARALVELAGAAVVGEAGNAATARRMARVLVPDLVLLDVRLPDLSGFELAAQLPSSCRVLLVSSHTWSDIDSRLEACGAVGFLPKEALTVSSLRALLTEVGP